MAGKIPVGTLITDIKLNGDQPVKTLRELRQAVSSTTSAWKAQEAVLRSAGKTTEAAEAKYKGLSDAVKSQRRLIDGLVEKQKSLKKQQEEIDTSTDKGKKAYESISAAIQKNATQTLKATSRLESLTKQQDRAKNSLTYYKSGLAEAQKTLKTTSAVSKSYVDRLESEGNHYKANEARISGYRSSISNLTKQYEIQSRELKRIASESGATSEAYKRQQIRVNETATSLNKAKSAVSGLEAEQRKINPTPWDRLKAKISSVNKESQETHRTLKEVFMGSALGNAVSNAVSNLGSSLKSAYTEGMNLNLAIAKINGRFKGMGMNTRQIQALDKQIGELKSNTNLAGDSASDLQAHMLNWSTIGFKGAMQMSKALAGVGDSSKMTGQQIDQMSAGLQRIGSTGKVTYSSLSRITKAAPTFMQALAKGAGMSESKLRTLLKTGDVTQKQFQTWIAKSSKYADESFKGYGQSQAGALKSMTVARQKLEQEFTKPIFDAKTSGLQALKNIMTSKEVMSGANQLGKAISNIIGYLDKHKGDIVAITKNVVSLGVEVGKAVWKDFAAIIQNIGKALGIVKGNGKESSSALHTLATATADLAKNKTAVKAISDAIIAMVAIKGIGKVSGGLFSIGKGAVTAYKSVKALHDGFKGIELAKDATAGEKAWAKFGGVLSKTFSGFRKVGSKTWTTVEKAGIKAWTGIEKGWAKASDLGTKAGKAIAKGFRATGNVLAKAGKWSWSKIKSGFNFAKKFGQEVGKKISAGIKATTKFSMGKRVATGALAGAAVATPEVINAVRDRHNANRRSQDIGGAVGAVAGGTLTSMIPVVGPMLAPVGAIIGKYAGRWGGQAVNNFTKGWQKKKPPKKFWSLENLGWSTHNMFRQVGKWGAGVGKKLGQGLQKGKSFAKKNSKELALTAVSPLLGIPALLYKNNPKFRKWANGVGRNIKSGLKTAGKAVNNFKNSLGKNFKKAWDTVYKHSSKGTRQIMRSTSKFAKNYVKINSKANKETLKNFSSFGKRLKKNHGNLFKTLGQTAKIQLNIEKKRWTSIWKNIRSAATGIWKGINRNASDMYKKLNSATHVGLGKVFSGFKSFGTNFKNFWSSLLKGIQSTFSHAIDNIKGAANNVNKFFHGKLKVGSLHLANGTDWRKKYGYPAILNDGHDSPETGNREGILNPDGSVEVQNGVNVKRWIFPWQDVINAHDMARIFRRSMRLANGTVNLRSLETNDPTKLLSTLTKLAKKKYDEDRQRHEKQKQRHDRNDNDRATERKRLIKQEHDVKAERAKIAKEIREALSKGRNTKGLTAQFNALTKHISNIKHSIAKTNPHHGQVYVDEGLLIGAKSRIGKSKWISDALFKKLTAKPKKRKTTSRRSTSHRRSASTRVRAVTRVSTPHISGKSVRVRAIVTGLNNVRSLARAISAVKSKHVKITASGSSAKSVSSLARTIKKIKGGTHKVIVKTTGQKSLKSLYRYTKKIKDKTHRVKVKTSGVKALKSLQKNITSVNKRVKSLNHITEKSRFGKQIAKQAQEAVKSLKGKGNFAKQFTSMVKKFDKDLKGMVKSSKKEFSSMWSSIEKSSKSGQNRVIHSLSSFSSKYKHGWSSLDSGVRRIFNRFWSQMKNSAGRGVNSVISVLNSAISKIDSVISEFGGSRHAVHKSGYVHYAKGTDANGRLTHDTLAVVNDAQAGPRQEAVVTDQNDIIIPHGNNRRMLLRKGWGVLNGTQTQSLGLPHFANGTGLKRLYEIAKHNWNHPVKTGQSMFGAVIGLTGAIKELASGMRNKSENQGTKWWSQLWKMVEDKVNDDLGPASGLLKAVEKLGRGKRYLWGGYGLDSKGLDCSGLVSTALEHYFHSGWGHLDVGGLWQHAHRISRSEAKPGDPVFWLPDEHVGVYAGHGMYYSAYGPNDGGPIGMQPVGSGATFGRFKGINTESSEDTKEAVKVKANNRLQKQIKNQVGQGFWRTIQKIADKYGEQFNGANSISGSMIEAAARKMHVHLPDGFVKDVLRVAMSESGNRNIKQQIHDVNSGGNEAQGPLQFTPQTFKAFAVAGHTNIHNPYDELLAFFNNSDWRNSIGWTTIWGHRKFDWLHSGPQGHRRFANGGIASSPSIFGEAGPEMAVPLIPSKSTRAWELIGKAVGILTANSNLNANQQRISNKDEKDEHDLLQAMLLVLQKMSVQSHDVHITLTTPEGRKLWEVIEPFYKSDRRQDMIKERRGLSARFR
ncbi:tape measure protein [Lactobacillus crispatus]|mgnify:CR=1 FL=1|uniref:tape measure protein n=1 Tax=Lactobacillus crispatus TaxID=47770 RepID=UPI0023A9E084|nr:tape measure protein [Lactobacillus crispatus]WEB23376.1 tape measure protein [Lactobacillus crispatus]